jgi:glycosyltransferase involved in cell wall biosynthesis
MNNKITALIPTYRRPEFLRRAMKSVLGQTYSNLQISVFDNASGDNTKDVVTSLSGNDARIKYSCHAENIGALANFRYALKSVDTPYFSILSDDDFVAIDFYENAVDVLNNYPAVMFVILNTLIVDENSNLIGDREATNRLSLYSGREGFDALHSGNIPITWTGMVFRKDVAHIYEEMDNRYDVASDMRFLFHATSRYDYAYLSKVGAFFTLHTESYSESRKIIDLVHQGIQISRYVDIFYDKNVSQDIRDRVEFYIKKLLSQNIYKPAIIESLVRIIKNYINFTEFGNNRIEANIKDFKGAGYVKTSSILKYLQNNTFSKMFARLLFGKYYKKKSIMNQSKMLSLQNGIYKKHFDNIKKISL